MPRPRIKVKKIINEEVKLFETEVVGHAETRINDRLKKMVDFGYITTIEANTISNNLKKVLSHEFDRYKSYGIKLGSFNVDPDSTSSNNVSWDAGNPYYRIWSEDRSDIVKDSTGNEFWGIIRNNKLITVFLRKDYQIRSAHKERNDDGGLGVTDVIVNINDLVG